MHIYPWQIDATPSQLSIDALNTAMPNLADIAQCTYTNGRLTPPPSVEHRSVENHYTTYVSYIYSTMHIYLWQIDLKSIEHRCLEYCYTKFGRSSRYSTMHIYPWQIDPIPLLQLSIDALNTTTLNLADIAQCTYTQGRLTPLPSSNRA